MRTARKKMVGRSCYYHACARIAGAKDDYLFTDVDKEKGMKIIQDLTRLFFIEPISVCWMGNHWHIVFYVGDRRPSLEEIAGRYNAYYGKNLIPLDPKLNPEKCRKVGEQLKHQMNSDDELLFMDGVHPQHNPISGHAWILKGQEKEIPTNTSRKRININGAININNYQAIAREDERINAQSTVELFKQIEAVYPSVRIPFISDTDSDLYRTLIPIQFGQLFRLKSDS